MDVVRTPDGKALVLVVSDHLDVQRMVRKAIGDFKSNPRLSEEVRERLQEFQTSERNRAKMPRNGGGFFSVNSSVGLKP